MPLTIALLAGLYRLETAPIVPEDGGPNQYPYGPDAIGWLLYRSDGFMSFHLMSAHRPPMKQLDLLGGTPEENNAALRSFASFCGRYTLEGDEIWYDIDVAWLPNFTGPRSHHTHAEVEGDTLRLISRPFEMAGRMSRTHFIWRRIASA